MDDYTDVGPLCVVRLTAEAALVRTDVDVWWVPLSLVEEETLAELNPEAMPQDVEEFNVVTWFAEKEGIE